MREDFRDLLFLAYWNTGTSAERGAREGLRAI